MKLLILVFFCLAFTFAWTADIEAGKMEILNTPEGKVTVFKEGVVIIDRETKITAQNALFYESKNLAIVRDSVKITNPSATIKSDTANYYLSERKTILKGNVLVTQESLEIRAPELIVEYQKDLASAQNGFFISEKPHSIAITGKTGKYSLNREEGIIDSLPHLEINKNETLKVNSQRLSFRNKDHFALATGKVLVTSGNAILACDSLTYDWNKDSGTAMGQPRLTENKNTIEGNTIYFFARDAKLERMKVEEKAYGNYYNDQGDRVEISGDRLNIFFVDGKTNSIEVKNVKLGKLYRQGEKTRIL